MLTTILIGVFIGAALTLEFILVNFEVQTKKAAEEISANIKAMLTGFYRLNAENAKLRVSVAAGEMTEEGKKVAAMTMAALDAVIAAAKKTE
jgi:hypothetical protein